MLALVITFLVAAYFLGPDLFSRWILSSKVPKRNISQTRSEEITRAIVWAIIPLVLAWFTRRIGPFPFPNNFKSDFVVFFNGLYSEAMFKEYGQKFFDSASVFVYANATILFRLYIITLAIALVINYLIGKYGAIRHVLTKKRESRIVSFLARFILGLISIIVLPRISEWHVILSPLLLPSDDINFAVDILTKSGNLYAGTLKDKMLDSSGQLQSLTLSETKRFRRAQYLEAQKQKSEIDPIKYWTSIPGNYFVIMASDIATLNVRHTPSTVKLYQDTFEDVAEALRKIVESRKARLKE